jgi:hypothetical protein
MMRLCGLGISLLTSLCFNESVLSQVCASANQFDDECVLQGISSMTRLCGALNQVTDESVLQRISSLTRLPGS